MGIESGGPRDIIVEDASDENDEVCPCCNDMDWLRAIVAYKKGACYVIFCGGCGKPVEERWTILP